LTKVQKNVIIKLGSKGSYLRKEGEESGKIFPPFYIENPVDTTGAGDNFAAGFLYALSEGKSVYDCARFANAVASVSVEHVGATTGVQSLEQVLERYGSEG